MASDDDAEDRVSGPVSSSDLPLSPGQDLARSRTSRGMTVSELAQRTKIRVSVILALEEERYDDIPKARVYIRGFLSSIARELGLSPDSILEPYLTRWQAWMDAQSGPL
ncbi:MAG: helix-turn-helix domain-containing protein [Myxococcota bacterium]